MELDDDKSDDALLAAAEEKVRVLATKPPSAMAATKKLLRRAEAACLAEQMDEKFARFDALLRGPEAAEALAAFTEKRKPDFSHFLLKENWHACSAMIFSTARMCW